MFCLVVPNLQGFWPNMAIDPSGTFAQFGHNSWHSHEWLRCARNNSNKVCDDRDSVPTAHLTLICTNLKGPFMGRPIIWLH
jgi:hypothetical protein